MKKKILGMCLGLALIFGAIQSAMAKDFPDVPKTHWAYNQIKELSDLDIIVGYPDGNFKPDEEITRAEFATMVVKTVDQDTFKVKFPVTFNDVDEDYWAYDMIQRAVYFDIVKPGNGYFYPEGVVTRAQAIMFTVNSLDSGNITEAQAEKALMNAYADYEVIPEYVKIHAGKAIIMGLIVKVPTQTKKLEAETPATRAEIAAYLANIKREVQFRANKKLEEARKPKKATGITIKGVEVNGEIATIPAGTILPVSAIGELSSNETKLGDNFKSKIPENLVTEENYLLIPKNSLVNGQVIDLKKSIYFIRNGQLVLETKTINNRNQDKAFSALAQDPDAKVLSWWRKALAAIVKGKKYTVDDGQVVFVKLLNPVKINLVRTEIVE